MTVCCLGRENDHRHRGEQCFCERHREREIQSTSSFSNIPSQSVARRLSRREGPSTPAPRPPSQKDVARSRGGGISFLDDAGRRRRRQALKSTFARIGLLTLKFSLTFTDFPSNVCVVPMLAFFVYARFFLPTVTTTRRRGRQSRPTRVMRFRHATRDASSENNETTTTTTKKKKKKK